MGAIDLLKTKKSTTQKGNDVLLQRIGKKIYVFSIKNGDVYWTAV